MPPGTVVPTAGAITGVFGPRPRYWSERMLDEGLVHVVSSDGHNTRRRRPAMREAAEACARLLGAAEADNLVRVRPLGVLSDAPLEKLPELPAGARVLGFNYDTGERYLSVEGFLPA